MKEEIENKTGLTVCFGSFLNTKKSTTAQQEQPNNTKQTTNNMKLSFQLVVVLSSVVGTVLIAAKPCANGYGQNDMVACNYCAEHGNGSKNKSCCNAIYHHSLGRDDDDWLDDHELIYNCYKLDAACNVGAKQCYPGLTCDASFLAVSCQLIVDDPNAHEAVATALVTSSSPGTNTTKGGLSFVVVVVGLLGAAMLAMTVVVQRRHQYSEVIDTTATTHVDV